MVYIYISQTEYIKKLLRKYEMSDCKPVNKPIVTEDDRASDDQDDEGYDIKR